MTSFRNFAFLVLLLFSVGLIHAQTPIDITAQLTFTTIDVPGAGYTGLWSINKAGDIVGNYGQDPNRDSHGFLYSNGTFTFLDYPGQSETVLHGINDAGVIVGYAGSNPLIGFLYDGTSFTNIKHGSDSATPALGVNNAGEVVGGTGTIYTTKGFDLRNGVFKRLNVPGQFVYVYASAIDNLGRVVGWTDNDGFTCRGNTCKIIDFPSASTTATLGINDSGVIVGWYVIPYGCLGCGLVLRNGKYFSFSYPGAMFTAATGINNSGQIVGQYQLPDYTYHGFVTSPIMTAHF